MYPSECGRVLKYITCKGKNGSSIIPKRDAEKWKLFYQHTTKSTKNTIFFRCILILSKKEITFWNREQNMVKMTTGCCPTLKNGNFWPVVWYLTSLQCKDFVKIYWTKSLQWQQKRHGGAFAIPVRGSATSIAPLHQDKNKTKQKNQPFYLQIWDFCPLRDTLCPLNICLKKIYFHFAQKVHFKKKKKKFNLESFVIFIETLNNGTLQNGC